MWKSTWTSRAPVPDKPAVLLSWCFTSTEARWPIRDGDRVGRGRQSEGSTAETARKRPERPWTTARTMEVLRRCSIAIAQRLVHCAIAVSTAVLGQSHEDDVRCTAVDEQLGQLKQRKSSFLSPGFQARSKDQEILEEGGGAGPSS